MCSIQKKKLGNNSRDSEIYELNPDADKSRIQKGYTLPIISEEFLAQNSLSVTDCFTERHNYIALPGFHINISSVVKGFVCLFSSLFCGPEGGCQDPYVTWSHVRVSDMAMCPSIRLG